MYYVGKFSVFGHFSRNFKEVDYRGTNEQGHMLNHMLWQTPKIITSKEFGCSMPEVHVKNRVFFINQLHSLYVSYSTFSFEIILFSYHIHNISFRKKSL